MNYEIFIACAIVGVWVACGLFLAIGMTYNLVIFYVREKQEKEREKEEKQKIKNMHDERINKKIKLFTDIFMEDYSFYSLHEIMKGSGYNYGLCGCPTAHIINDWDVIISASKKVCINKEFHLVEFQVASLFNSGGKLKIRYDKLYYIIAIDQNEFFEKKYLETIHKIFKKHISKNKINGIEYADEIIQIDYQFQCGHWKWQYKNSVVIETVKKTAYVKVFKSLKELIADWILDLSRI